MAPRRDTRRRMLLSAVDLMRERGAAGVTIDAVLERSGAPRGSVYYHFPGGRAELVADALDLAGASITALIEGASGDGAIQALHRFSAFWASVLRDSDFAAGCPVVSVAVQCLFTALVTHVRLLGTLHIARPEAGRCEFRVAGP